MTIVAGPAPIKSVKCYGCKVKLTFTLCVDDLTPGYFDGDYTEAGPPGVGVECPRCADLTEVSAPDSLIEAVHTKKGKR
jgi:hypothetical protein